MVFKGCPRCKGDLWVEEDIGSSARDSVCVQCGSRRAIQPARAGPKTQDQIDATRWLMAQRPTRTSAYGL
jgi:DNA-directed RNA polymerase subunit RPC12/RpoP